MILYLVTFCLMLSFIYILSNLLLLLVPVKVYLTHPVWSVLCISVMSNFFMKCVVADLVMLLRFLFGLFDYILSIKQIQSPIRIIFFRFLRFFCSSLWKFLFSIWSTGAYIFTILYVISSFILISLALPGINSMLAVIFEAKIFFNKLMIPSF